MLKLKEKFSFNATVAQSVEQLIRNQQVACSIHVISSRNSVFKAHCFFIFNIYRNKKVRSLSYAPKNASLKAATQFSILPQYVKMSMHFCHNKNTHCGEICSIASQAHYNIKNCFLQYNMVDYVKLYIENLILICYINIIKTRKDVIL